MVQQLKRAGFNCKFKPSRSCPGRHAVGERATHHPRRVACEIVQENLTSIMSNAENSDDTEFSVVGSRDVVPLPFIRRMRYHLDSCAGTNKSQFVTGGLGLVVSVGRLDCVHLLFMVVGHTKFGPDLVARAIAGKYHRKDTFNHGMLNSHIMNYATAIGYDDNLLETWRRATPLMFRAVENIMSYRSFMIMADDGSMELLSVTPPAEMEKYPSKGLYYRWKDVVSHSEKLAHRMLTTIIPSVLDGTYRGIGEGSLRQQGEQEKLRLLPEAVSEARRVRLFVQRTESDEYCMEQEGWMTDWSSEQANKVLKIITNFAKLGDKDKKPYGSKKKQISEQFSKFVPPQYVPDEFEIGVTSNVKKTAKFTPVQTYFSTQVGSSNRDIVAGSSFGGERAGVNKAGDGYPPRSAAKLKKPRWNRKKCAPMLTSILRQHFGGKVPNSSFDVRKLASLMPRDPGLDEWCPRILRRYAVSLKEEGLL